jgi:hypothetical protein
MPDCASPGIPPIASVPLISSGGRHPTSLLHETVPSVFATEQIGRPCCVFPSCGFPSSEHSAHLGAFALYWLRVYGLQLLLGLRKRCVLPPLNSTQVLHFASGLVVWIVAGTLPDLTLELPDQKARGFLSRIALPR